MASGMYEAVVPAPHPAQPADGAAEPSPTGLTIDDLGDLLESLTERLVRHQEGKVLSAAQALDPRLCADDILQPDDYPALASDPRWNYEDGVLAGMRAVQIALRAELRRRR